MIKKVAVVGLAVVAALAALGSSKMALANFFPDLHLNEIARQATEAARQARCAAIKGQIGEKITNFQNINSAQLSKYNDLKNKLSEMIIDIDEKGYNVTKLRTDYRELSSKIDKYKVDFAVFRIRANDAKDSMCRGATTDDQVRDKLSDARSMLRAVKSDAQSINNYYKNTIKSDISEVKQQRYVEN